MIVTRGYGTGQLIVTRGYGIVSFIPEFVLSKIRYVFKRSKTITLFSTKKEKDKFKKIFI